LKAGIFVGPQIHKLMKDKDFEKTINTREKEKKRHGPPSDLLLKTF
jgi:hypothetical protein